MISWISSQKFKLNIPPYRQLAYCITLLSTSNYGIQLAKTSHMCSTALSDLTKNISSWLAACVAEVRDSNLGLSGDARSTLHTLLVRCTYLFSRPFTKNTTVTSKAN